MRKTKKILCSLLFASMMIATCGCAGGTSVPVTENTSDISDDASASEVTSAATESTNLAVDETPAAKPEDVFLDGQVRISPLNASETNGGSFEGWGTSLCWWANRIGYSDSLAQQAADLFYGDDGLDLNIMRYNIGGGNDPAHNHIYAFAVTCYNSIVDNNSRSAPVSSVFIVFFHIDEYICFERIINTYIIICFCNFSCFINATGSYIVSVI